MVFYYHIDTMGGGQNPAEYTTRVKCTREWGGGEERTTREALGDEGMSGTRVRLVAIRECWGGGVTIGALTIGDSHLETLNWRLAIGAHKSGVTIGGSQSEAHNSEVHRSEHHEPD